MTAREALQAELDTVTTNHADAEKAVAAAKLALVAARATLAGLGEQKRRLTAAIAELDGSRWKRNKPADCSACRISTTASAAKPTRNRRVHVKPEPEPVPTEEATTDGS